MFFLYYFPLIFRARPTVWVFKSYWKPLFHFLYLNSTLVWQSRVFFLLDIFSDLHDSIFQTISRSHRCISWRERSLEENQILSCSIFHNMPSYCSIKPFYSREIHCFQNDCELGVHLITFWLQIEFFLCYCLYFFLNLRNFWIFIRNELKETFSTFLQKKFFPWAESKQNWHFSCFYPNLLSTTISFSKFPW